MPVTAEIARVLDETDVALLAAEKGSRPAPLQRLGDRHHALARCLAGGMGTSDAAVTCGYTVSRVSILCDDPAFQELLTFYREDMNAQYRDLHARLSGLAQDAAELLQDQLEEDMAREVTDRKVTIGQLMEVAKLGADRTGFGPQSSTTNLNVNVDLAGRLKAARERVEARKLTGDGDA